MLTGAVTLLKELRATVEAIKEGKLRSKMEHQLFDLHKIIFTAQEDILMLQERIAMLQRENRELINGRDGMHQGQADLEAYAIRKLARDVYVYVNKDFSGGIKDASKFCPSCFGQHKISPLQFEKEDFHRDTLKCISCGLRVVIPNDIKMDCVTKPRSRGF